MGYQGKSHVLVVMANKDVYYVTSNDARFILSVLEQPNHPNYISIRDAKSGAEVVLSALNISSIVAERQDER